MFSILRTSGVWVFFFRAAGSGVRLLGTVSIPYLVDGADVGKILIIITAMSVFPLYCSLEYYTYSNRAFIENAGKNSWSLYVLSTLLVSSAGVLIFYPLQLLFVYFAGVDIGNTIVFFMCVVLVLDCIQNEIIRTLVLLESIPTSAFVYFCKQVCLFAPLAIISISDGGFSVLLWVQLYSLFSVVLVSLVLIYAFYRRPLSKVRPTELLNHISEGRSVVRNYFVSGVVGKFTGHADRIVAGLLIPEPVLAAYLYTLNLVHGASSFIEPLINQVILAPVLKKGFHTKESRALIVRGARNLTIFCAASILVFLLLANIPSQIAVLLADINGFFVVLLIIAIQFNIYGKFLLYLARLDKFYMFVSILYLIAFGIVYLFPMYVGLISDLNSLIFTLTLVQLSTSVFIVRKIVVQADA